MADEVKAKPRRGLHVPRDLSEDYYSEAFKQANEWEQRESDFQRRFGNEARLKNWIQELVSHMPYGATVWDVTKCVEYRELKPEDALPKDAPKGAEVKGNRNRADSSISSAMSEMEAMGILRWRNEGKLKDEDGNPVSGGEMRMGGYGTPRRVYEVVPREEWDDAEQKTKARRAANRARQAFINGGAAAILEQSNRADAAENRVAVLEAEQQVIAKYYGLPDWLLLPKGAN